MSATQVFEDPLLLTSITSFLDPEDTVHLISSVSRDKLFVDTIEHILQLKKQKKDNEKYSVFEDLLKWHIDIFEMNKQNQLTLQILAIENVFCFLFENKWFLKCPRYDVLQKVLELKLVEFCIDDHGLYAFQALFYLEELFDISVRAYYGEDDEPVEYITTSENQIIIL